MVSRGGVRPGEGEGQGVGLRESQEMQRLASNAGRAETRQGFALRKSKFKREKNITWLGEVSYLGLSGLVTFSLRHK